MGTETKIREFITQNLMVFEKDVTFTDQDNIFEMGFVNSLFAMKLLNYLESEFKVEIEEHDMDIQNFSSVVNITALIDKYLK
ncbi:MAG: acyl carrier protein [Bacteroidales bacterium]|nr:acyl carrier protein [Bacteroidales bacterium]